MTTHEVLTSLLWLVAGGYVLYLAWFLARQIRQQRTGNSGQKLKAEG